jgi:hypothetical protein
MRAFDCEQFRKEARDRNLFQAVEDSSSQCSSARAESSGSSESHHGGREIEEFQKNSSAKTNGKCGSHQPSQLTRYRQVVPKPFGLDERRPGVINRVRASQIFRQITSYMSVSWKCLSHSSFFCVDDLENANSRNSWRV